MKTTKKFLSVLLAVIMIMTSMSVCFGPISLKASAADDAALVNAFVSAVQCDAMKNFPTLTKVETNNNKSGESKIIYKTFTYETDNYAYFEQVVNVIKKLDEAIKGLDEYKNGHAHNNNQNCQDGWGKTTATDKCTDLGWIERHLKLAIGDARLATLNGTYHLDRLFAAVFNMDGTTDKRNADNDEDMNDQKNKIEASIQNILIVRATKATTKIASYASIDAIPDNLESEYKYQLNMTRKNYTTKSGCSNVNHYHFALSSNEDAGKIFAPAATATISTNKSVLTSARTTFESTYASYYNAKDASDIVAISDNVNTLTVVKEAFVSSRDGVKNTFNTEIYNKFFDEDKVEQAIKLLGDAIQFLQFKPIVDELNRLNAIDYSSYDESQLLSHLTAFDAEMAKYDILDAATQQLVLDNFDLPIVEIKANLKKLRHDYEVYGIRRLKAQTDTHMNSSKDWNVDMVDEGTLTSAMTTQYIGYIGNDIALFGNYVYENVAEVCGANYMTDLNAFYNNLLNLGKVARYNEDFIREYAKYRDEVKSAIAVDSETLLESVMGYDSWVTGLKNLVNSMKSELGEEVANKLFDELYEPMQEYINNAYIVLVERTESEVNNAYDLLAAYRAEYGETVTMSSVSKYKAFRYAVESVNVEAYEFLVGSPNAAVSQQTIERYNAIQVIFPAYEEFLASYGFKNWQTSTIDNIIRKDTEDDIARENEDIDGDGIGEYVADDAKVENVINVLDAALSNAAVQDLIGINIGEMLTDLVKGAILTDGFINTVVMMLYPLVLKEFGKVFSNDLPAEASGQKVTYLKNLYNVFDGAAFYVYPDQLADVLTGDQYTDTRTRLNNAYKNFDKEFGVSTGGLSYTTIPDPDPEAKPNANGGQRVIVEKCAWDSKELMKEVIDDDGNVVIDEETGEPKLECALTWGVDAYKETIEADGVVTAEEQAAFENYFYNAADDALEGLKPLLLALIANKAWESNQSGLAEAVGGLATVSLKLGATANSGYANLLVPVYEALGVSYTSVSTVESTYTNSTNTKASKDVALILEAILSPIFTFVENIGTAPLNTLLNALPNICHALSAQMVTPLLSMLKTNIWYEAPIGGLASMCGIDTPKGDVAIDVGEMLNINDLIDLSDGLNSVLRQFGIDIPAIDQGYIATLGTLGTITTQRKQNVYTGLSSGTAYHITANKADVLLYLVDYLLDALAQPGFLDMIGGLLGGNKEEAEAPAEPEAPAEGEEGAEEKEDILTTILNNIKNDPDAAIAGIVELLNQKEYDTLENYNWYNGYIDDVEVGTLTDPAVQVYMNNENDWTEEKAEYLYNNIDAIVAAILKMAEVDLDKETEDVDGSLGELIGGIFNAKTLTSIARLLGSISDINALLAPKAEEEVTPENGETPEASEPETVAEGEDATEGEEDENGATAAPALDINALIKEFLGIDLKTAFGMYAEIPTAEEDPEYIYEGFKDVDSIDEFATALASMLAPLSPVLDFILEGKNLVINLSATQKVNLIGYNGYDNAIVPILEALGCDVEALGNNDALALTLAALAGKIDALVNGGTVKGIIDILPGLFYFLAGNNLATAVRNLLQPVYVILDTIRPIYNVDLAELLAGIEIKGEPLGLDLDVLNLNFVFDLIKKLLPADLDLGTLLDDVKGLIYSICKLVGAEYDSVSTLAGQTIWKKGQYGAFSQADLITVLLSYVLDWAIVPENGAKLDALLGTDGIIENINKVFADIKIEYKTPTWNYFATDAEWADYIENGTALPNTITSLKYENDWTEYAAQYFADNLPALVDEVVAMVTKDEKATVAGLLNDLVNGNLGEYFTAETIETLIGYIGGVLANVDDTLLKVGYEILGVDLEALKNYTCEADVKDLASFVEELARILDSYAKPLVDLLFFGDDIRLAKKSDNTDTIVINGGYGYEQGLAIILEALGCENLPAVEDATATNVLAALVARVNEILKAPVAEILEMLPNLVYVLNANAVGVAVDNLLQPVYALLNKINSLGLLENPIVIADLLKFKNKEGEEVAIDLAALSLANVVEIVESLTGLKLDAAENVLVNLYLGKIEKTQFGYKMVADTKDMITVILVTALDLISDDDFAAQLDEMLGTEIISSIETVFAGIAPVYADPDWDYALAENGTVDAMKYSITYPTNWNEETAAYVTEILLSDEFDALITGLIDKNYGSLSELLNAKINVFTSENLETVVGLITNLLGDISEGILDAAGVLLNVDLVGLRKHEIPADIDNVKEFAAELATILSDYAPGVVEWLLLGNDYKFFYTDADGSGVNVEGTDYITINGAEGYKNGLAILLEALGCEDLPSAVITEENTTAKIIEGVLTSLANRIDEILADPINEVFELLPNLFYFLNANGVAVAIKNTTAALTALSTKVQVFADINLDVSKMVDLKALLKIEDTDAAISMENLSMAAILEAVGLMVGLDLTHIEKVLVGFALGEIKTYESVSKYNGVAKKMSYTTDFDKKALVTVVANLALITLADEANAEFVKGLVGDAAYETIINVLAIDESVAYEYAEWLYTEKANTGNKFSALGDSGFAYGPNYTKVEAQYIADHFGTFVDNIINLLGIQINGEYVNSLSDLVTDLVGGSLYNSSNVVAIQDALAGLLNGIATLEVEGVVVGGYIVEVLKKSLGIDITAVAEVNVPEFSDDKAAFITALANVLDPLGPILNWLLTNKDISFFTDLDKTAFVQLPGAKGYQNGIVLLLEALDCEGIVDPATLNEDADGADIVIAIIEPLLNKLDEILANPADEIFAILPNLVYFINSKGIDVVVKNTLNAVYTILNAIEPVAKVDLYAIVGDLLGVENFDKAIVDFDLLVDVLLGKFELAGFSFEGITGADLAGLTTGTLISYDSFADQNAEGSKKAYKMVYGGKDAQADMVTSILVLLIKFVTTEGNQEAIVALLKSIGLTAEGEKYLAAMIEFLATCIADTKLGMDAALYSIYYVYYGVDKGAAEVVKGKDDLSKQWQTKLEELNKNSPNENAQVGDLLTDIFDIIFETDDEGENGVLDNSGVASQGGLTFFQKIAKFFQEIAEFFRNLFSFGKK